MQSLVDYLIRPTTIMSDVVEVIDRGAVKVALVTDEESCLLGLVTDGDFRRALLRGMQMDTPVERFMYREFRSLPTTATEEQALTLMRRENIQQIPVLDEKGRVVRLFTLEDLNKPKELPNSVVIMAGGMGKRLQHFTRKCPKPMLQVGGKPILEIILEQCITAGFRHFYFSVNYLKEQIKDYFADGSNWQVSIEYLEEEKPLGTAGALSLLPVRPEHALLVINGDVLTRADYRQLVHFHAEHESIATLCVQEHTTQIPYGVVRMDDLKVYAIEEKPVLSHYMNAGIYLLGPALLDLVPPDQFFDMPQLIEKAIAERYRISAFPIHEYWLDIGLPETLNRAHEEWQ